MSFLHLINFLATELEQKNIFEVGLRAICFNISSILYKFMITLYDIFELLCTTRILNNEIISAISTRIGLILGIVMFFSIVFSFIKMLIDPDSISNKDTGALPIIKKMLLVLVMFGSFNFVFDFLYGVQKFVVENRVVSNFILPYQLVDEDLDSFGNTLSYQLMFSFYSVADFSIYNSQLKNKEQENIEDCNGYYIAFQNQVINEGNFDLGKACLDRTVEVEGISDGQKREVFIVNYNYLFSIGIALFVDYVLLMYCFKIGVRMIQLMLLEVLAPVAILSYLSPKKDNMFSKWIKIYFATYLDVFIRIGIISFVVFLIATIFQSEAVNGFGGIFDGLGTVSGDVKIIVKIILVLSLLTFAKKAPDLLKELFPAGASKLGFGLSMKDVVGLQRVFKTATGIVGGAAAGAAIGLIGGSGWAKLGGFAGGMLKGGFSGLKGQGLTKTATSAWKNQAKANLAYANAKANGATWFGYQMTHLQQGLNMRTAYDIDEGEVSTLENFSKIRDQVENRADNNSVVKQLKKRFETIQQSGQQANETADEFNARVRAAEKSWKDTRAAMITAAMNGSDTFVGDAFINGHLEHNISSTATPEEQQFMKALKSQANRIINSNSNLFNGYDAINNYTNLDDNTNKATDAVIERRSTSRYAKNRANAGK